MTVAVQILESVSLSLVREFLKRKGLSSTYHELDKEYPRDERSITNRTELARILHMERLLKRNKEMEQPVRTMLEVIARYLIDPDEEPELPGRREQEKDDVYSYQPPLVRPKSQRRVSNAHNEPLDRDLGLMITEDDLDTELIAGRGMQDVYQSDIPQPSPEEITQTQQHHRTNKHRKSRKQSNQNSHQKPDQQEANNLQTKHSGHLTAGFGEGKQVPNLTQQSSTFISETDQNGDTTSDTPTGSDESETTPSSLSNQDSGKDISPAPTNTTVECPEEPPPAPPPQDMDTKETPEVTAEVKLKPKPPPKMPDYLNSTMKNNLEKSMELLRQRRMSQLKLDSVIGATNQESCVDEDHNEADRGDKAKNERLTETDTNDDSNTELEDDSYSPRIISSPLIDKPYSDSPEPEVDDDDNTKPGGDKPETIITRQPVQFMAVKSVISTAKSIDVKTATELKRLVLGSASVLFYDNWLCQGISFCDIPSLMFGMIQQRQGTCGLLSVVQAYFIIELLFCDSKTKELPAQKKLSLSPDVRSRILARAISKMLWRCGEEKRAVLALPSDTTIITGGGRYKPDHITETLMINMIDNYEDVLKYTTKFLPYFEDDDCNGAILLLYSAVLSRGIEQVIDDMESADTPLINDFAMCSQELVNLLMCGKAASHVFNDSMEVTQGVGKTIILKGIPCRSDVGFMSLKEHQNRKYQVGTFVKTPKYPVWITCMDDRYSLVFCLNKDLISDWKAEKRFDLIYHDTLAQNDSPVRLTLDTTNRFYTAPENDDEVPPLDLVLRTKWKDAKIDWS